MSKWREMTETPDVPVGNARTLVVAWKNKKTGAIRSGTLCYLNQMLLHTDDACICDTKEPACDGGDGCSVSGWCDNEPNSDYDDYYVRAQLDHEYGVALAWCQLPEYKVAPVVDIPAPGDA